ncbi:MAG TPA: hypothetical protein V6D08_18185 [Candidatus Obscuribacterales bacterium]
MATNDPDTGTDAESSSSGEAPAQNAESGVVRLIREQKEQTARLKSGGRSGISSEFGRVTLTGAEDVSAAARVVRQVVGKHFGHGQEGAAPTPAPEPAEEKTTSPEPQQPVNPIQAGTRTGDISSQFGRLILDGLQAMSGAFRKGGGTEAGRTDLQHPNHGAAARAGATAENGTLGLGSTQPATDEMAEQQAGHGGAHGGASSGLRRAFMDGFQAISNAFRSAVNHGSQTSLHGTQVPEAFELEHVSAGTRQPTDAASDMMRPSWREQLFRKERDDLLGVLVRIPYDEVRDQMSRNIREFETRARERSVPVEQVADTYRTLIRLMEDPDHCSPLEQNARLLLAMQVLRQSAHPDNVSQSAHVTAEIAAQEVLTYELRPALVAHLVTETALSGRYTSPEGRLVVLSQEELSPDEQALDPIGNEGRNRSYASQIFQTVQLHLQLQSGNPYH